MIIEIKDDLDGKARRKLLQLLPLIYALEKFDKRDDVANWLGISRRWLTELLRTIPELSCYKINPNYALSILHHYKDEAVDDPMKTLFEAHLARAVKDIEVRDNPKKIKEISDRIRRLYYDD